MDVVLRYDALQEGCLPIQMKRGTCVGHGYSGCCGLAPIVFFLPPMQIENLYGSLR